MDEQQFKAIVALLQGLNSSGSLTPADLSIMQNSILAVLSGTYRQPKIGKTSDELFMENAPSIIHAQESADLTLRDMANDIISGLALFDLKQKYRTQITDTGLSGLTGADVLSNEYLSELSVMKSEWDQYQKAERTNAQLKIDNDPFLKLGLPSFDERYDPRQTNPEVFKSIATEFQERRKASAPTPSKNTSQGGIRPNPDNPEYNPINYLNTPIVTGGLIDAIQGNKQLASDRDFIEMIKSVDKSVRRFEDDAAYAAAHNRAPNLNAAGFAADLRKWIGRGLTAGANPIQGGTGHERDRPFTPAEINAIEQYISQLEKGVPTRTNTIVASSVTPEGLRLKRNALSANKPAAGVAANTTVAQESYLNEKVMQLLSSKMLQENKTPLVDALVQHGIFATAAKIPKKTSKPSQKYTVKGSEIFPVGK